MTAEPPGGAPERRRYDSPVRRERTARTHERIIDAGAVILDEHPVWNWDALTIRAVAERAGVSERTVYRHFAHERALRDAVMQRLEEESGLQIEALGLEDLQEFTARVLAYVSTFPLAPRTTHDATLLAASRRQREILLGAVRHASPRWSARDRTIAAAVLDVVRSVGSYERLVADWGLDPDDAIIAATWAIGIVEDAIRAGQRPPR